MLCHPVLDLITLLFKATRYSSRNLYIPQCRFEFGQVGVEFVPADAERLRLGHVAVGGGEEGVVPVGQLFGLGGEVSSSFSTRLIFSLESSKNPV